MRVTVSFSTFDPLFSDAPALCDLCESKPSVFRFQTRTDDDAAQLRPVHGFCCSPCATELLDKVQREECLTWEKEELSVECDEVDVENFHERRLATFGVPDRN